MFTDHNFHLKSSCIKIDISTYYKFQVKYMFEILYFVIRQSILLIINQSLFQFREDNSTYVVHQTLPFQNIGVYLLNHFSFLQSVTLTFVMLAESKHYSFRPWRNKLNIRICWKFYKRNILFLSDIRKDFLSFYIGLYFHQCLLCVSL